MIKKIISLWNDWFEEYNQILKDYPLSIWHPLGHPWAVYFNPEWFENKESKDS